MALTTAPEIDRHDKSLFWKRLKSLSDQRDSVALSNLCNATRNLMESATAISRHIVKSLPQFTSHDEIHLWNVLSFMEQLAGGQQGIEQLDAGDCAMAIWAAFIHDLGMVLEADELAHLDAADQFDRRETNAERPSAWSESRVQAWRAYRDGSEHWRSIQQAPHADSSRMKLGMIRAAFIRDSHAREDAHTGHCRIEDWLRFLTEGDLLLRQVCEDFATSGRLIRVAVSHNQDIGWLPRQLSAICGSEFHAEFMDADLGTIHWTWIGWLLRLADVFDCDKSRTPRILFDHGGITDNRSRAEWQKHLAIRQPPVWHAGADNETLLYTCQTCPSPIVEKAIHQILGWMNDEIAKVRSAWNSLPSDTHEELKLDLPSEAKVNIKQRKGGYLYHDMEFRLDRDAVVELLMGESLYGGPELALRELVQNALDAVHLRDQRNRLAAALDEKGSKEKARQPHQHWGGQQPEVNVSWGTENGRRFVRVQDNGVGMTVGTMRRFLTQIGKSYYKSDDFRAEQEMMRQHGILCSAISQFGIGFLSVFMLADHVIIHTWPVGASDLAPSAATDLQESARFPFRAEIHGPHGLLAFYPDHSVTTPGTTVTIWLKDQFVLPQWNRDLLIGKLRKEFYRIELPADSKALIEEETKTAADTQQILDPAFQIGRFIVWPLYPVKLGSTERDPIVIDAGFHCRELLPLDLNRLRKSALDQGLDIPELARVAWQACDWADEQRAESGVSGTGSRIRLIGPQVEKTIEQIATPAEWATISDELPSGHARLSIGYLVESQLPEVLMRYQCLVNGVRIVPGYQPSREDNDCKLPGILETVPLLPGVGGWVWIDLRGAAMPRLRADRSAPTETQPAQLDLPGLMQRWLSCWPNSLPHWITALTACRDLVRPVAIASNSSVRITLQGINGELTNNLFLCERRLIRGIHQGLPANEAQLVNRDPDIDFKYDFEFATALDRAPNADVALTSVHNRDFERAFVQALEIALTFAQTRLRHVDEMGGDFEPMSNSTRERARHLCHGQKLRLFARLLQSHLASECLWPDLQHAHPGLRIAGLGTALNGVSLVGPLHIQDSQDAVATPDYFADYDLCAPFTAFLMPGSCRRLNTWLTQRYWRAVCMLPFLLGQEPTASWRAQRHRPRLPNGTERLMLFIPKPEQDEWLFADRSRDDWQAGSASALWDLRTGEVLFADGVHTEQSLRAEGKPLRRWVV